MVISTQGRYTRTAIVLHWLILALLVFAALWLVSPLMLRSKRSGSWSRAG